MTFASEPARRHGTAPRTAVLLVNLGTPDAPTTPALRRYLAEFLADPRVVEIPRAAWLPILHGVILQTRPAKSAAKYASIWTAEGSPLAAGTAKQSKLLTSYLTERGHHDLLVKHAMRYGNPSVASALDELKAQGAERILVLPMYPQYAAATTASANDAVMAWMVRQRRQPEMRFVNHYHDHPGYIAALAQRVTDHWRSHGRSERLVLSFHGVPERSLHLGDPYHCECHKTARLLMEKLGLGKDEALVTFQSRFGRAKWLGPYTEPTLIALAKGGVQKVAVMCPGFVTDCLETLEEIAQEGRAAFVQAGGREFHYIGCVNDQPVWMNALADIALHHMQGWLEAAPSAGELVQQQERARALGAKA